MLVFFFVDSEEEGSENGEVLCVPSRLEASLDVFQPHVQ